MTEKKNRQKSKKLPIFLVRQLYRMQYGYTKIIVFISIFNTVSLLMVAFSLENFFEIKIWHLLVIYFSIILFLLIMVFFLESFGAWHSEQKQIFNMQQSEFWRDKIELQTLLLTKYLDYPEDEIEKRIQIIERKLFEKKI